jgi:hypothetical protein
MLLTARERLSDNWKSVKKIKKVSKIVHFVKNN